MTDGHLTIPKRQQKTVRGEAGFVLVLALVVLAVFSALVVLIISGSSSTARLARLAEDEARERAVLQAASVRSLYALIAEDTFEPLALDPAGLADRWRFDDRTLRITFEPEAGKADLNTADMQIVDAFLHDPSLPARIAVDAGRRIAAARRTDQPVPSVMALLPACARLGGAATAFERMFTVLTHGRGIDPQAMPAGQLKRLPFISASDYQILTEPGPIHRLPLDDRRLAHLRSLLSDPRPVYTLRLSPEAGGAERVISVYLTLERPHVRVISERQVVRAGIDLCGS